MDHQVDLTIQRRRQRSFGIEEEVRTSPTILDAWPHGQVEPKMGIGKEEHTQDRLNHKGIVSAR